MMKKTNLLTTLVAAVVMLLVSTTVSAQSASGKIYERQEVDVPAEYPGGGMGFTDFFVRNVRYPKDAMKARQEGVVRMEFIVERDGSITNIKVKESVCESLDAEALRVTKLLPKYTPAKKNGKAVRMRIVIPFTFRLK